MNKQKSLVGMEIDRANHTIEASQLKLINRALYHPDPYLPQPAAIEPYASLPNFMLGNLMDAPKIYRTLGLNVKNVLVSRESVIVHRPLQAGDQVETRTFLTNIYEQQVSGNPIGFAVLETIGQILNHIAFVSERILAVRGGFQRGGRQ